MNSDQGVDKTTIPLSYFEDVLALEFAEINARRERRHGGQPTEAFRNPIARRVAEPAPSKGVVAAVDPAPLRAVQRASSRELSPDPAILFPDPPPDPNSKTTKRLTPEATPDGALPPTGDGAPTIQSPDAPEVSAQKSETYKKRPTPVPCTATGLAFSGGGVRSAAVCLGVLQGLNLTGRLASFDYLSTVSGGGYIGASYSAALAKQSPGGAKFPFGDGIADGPEVAHLRNYSNYLLPRNQPALTNVVEAAAVVLRGILANFVHLLAGIMLCVFLTQLAFPTYQALGAGSFLSSLFYSLFPFGGYANGPGTTFLQTYYLLGFLGLTLIGWGVMRSFNIFGAKLRDTESPAIRFSGGLLIATFALAVLDSQPMVIRALAILIQSPEGTTCGVPLVGPLRALFDALPFTNRYGGLTLAAFATGVSYFGQAIGKFLEIRKAEQGWPTIAKRLIAKLALVIAALVLPFAVWAFYLGLCVIALNGWTWPQVVTAADCNSLLFQNTEGDQGIWITLAFALIPGFGVLLLNPNAYSLHGFYRDRLSKAFLFWVPTKTTEEPLPLDTMKLSDLINSDGPFPIVNAALNVQGSPSANMRGRNADFFMFTPLHTGSDLTQYVPMAGHGMESVDPALDFATAIAISGAAVSANMGSSTVRLLSPTLALLNLRLGYWLRNPRSLAEKVDQRLLGGWRRKMITRLKSKFHLMAEMLNMLREDSDEIYLTDGGHLENLGIYELLKRGCALIVAVDAESDPAMAFDSFQRLQRYARIDLGVRIDLPWEGIADTVKAVDKALLDGPQLRSPGPHVAVGRITYADGVEGILIYCKSSISGDEKDYILDYKKRNPAFPHETTGDQFFSEEQFESYRALGFHMIDRFFNDGKEAFGFAPQKTGVFRNKTSLWTEIDRTLPKQQLTGFP